jgi:hypothetical protein
VPIYVKILHHTRKTTSMEVRGVAIIKAKTKRTNSNAYNNSGQVQLEGQRIIGKIEKNVQAM